MEQDESGVVAFPGRADPLVPIIVSLGKVGRKKARQIEAGKGPVSQHIERAVRRAQSGFAAEERLVFVPVVLVYQRKRKRRRRRTLGCLLP
jgi:hypothetical protein